MLGCAQKSTNILKGVVLANFLSIGAVSTPPPPSLLPHVTTWTWVLHDSCLLFLAAFFSPARVYLACRVRLCESFVWALGSVASPVPPLSVNTGSCCLPLNTPRRSSLYEVLSPDWMNVFSVNCRGVGLWDPCYYQTLYICDPGWI